MDRLVSPRISCTEVASEAIITRHYNVATLIIVPAELSTDLLDLSLSLSPSLKVEIYTYDAKRRGGGRKREREREARLIS